MRFCLLVSFRFWDESIDYTSLYGLFRGISTFSYKPLLDFMQLFIQYENYFTQMLLYLCNAQINDKNGYITTLTEIHTNSIHFI